MKDQKDFKTFVSSKEKKESIEIQENSEKLDDIINENKSILQKFVISNSELSNTDLISLIVFNETDKLNESSVNSLVEFGYITKATNIITESGHEFINSEATINRVKGLI